MPPLGGIPFGTSDISSSGPGGDVTIELQGDVNGGPETGTNIVIDTVIANGAVTESKIADSAVTNAKLFPEAVTIDKMAPNSVGNNQIIDFAVDTAKLADGAVETDKVANNAITTPKMMLFPPNCFVGNPTGSYFEMQFMELGVFGTTLIGTPNQAAARDALGILDVTDWRNYAISRARTLLSLSGPCSVCVDEPFVNRVTAADGGGANNPTSLNFFTGSADNGALGRPGGWKTILNNQSWKNYDSAVAEVVGNVGTQKWYQLWRVRMDTIAATGTQVQLGFINLAFSVQQPLCGIQESGSATKFRFFDGTSGVNSTVDIDDEIHVFEMWGTGDGVIHGSVDGETPVSYTTAKTDAVTPFVQTVNLSAETPGVELDHFVCITE